VEHGWRWCRRNPAVAGLVTAVAVTLVLGTVFATFFGVQANRSAEEARAVARRASDRSYISDLRLVQRAWEGNHP
jgi:hypothetical protein